VDIGSSDQELFDPMRPPGLAAKQHLARNATANWWEK
jgi:hypothetical protein